MRKHLHIFLFGVASISNVGAMGAEPGYTDAKVRYRIYGGGLGDPVEASERDAKIAFSIGGQAAAKMFKAMGPDIKDRCTDSAGVRVRAKDGENVLCMRYRHGAYSCRFGFDLQSGKSVGGSVC